MPELRYYYRISSDLIDHGFHEGLPVVTSCALGIQAGFLAFAIKQAYAELPIRIYSVRVSMRDWNTGKSQLHIA